MKYIGNSKSLKSIGFIKLPNRAIWAKKAKKKNEVTVILTMAKIPAQSEAQTLQTDNFDPDNRLPKKSDST